MYLANIICRCLGPFCHCLTLAHHRKCSFDRCNPKMIVMFKSETLNNSNEADICVSCVYFIDSENIHNHHSNKVEAR